MLDSPVVYQRKSARLDKRITFKKNSSNVDFIYILLRRLRVVFQDLKLCTWNKKDTDVSHNPSLGESNCGLIYLSKLPLKGNPLGSECVCTLACTNNTRYYAQE